MSDNPADTGKSGWGVDTPQRERVMRALRFEKPDRIPILFLNREPLVGDVAVCWNLALQDANRMTEWGVKFESLDDGTMGQMTNPPIRDWSDLNHYRFPEFQPEVRRANLNEFKAGTEGLYRLGSLNLSGFTCYCSLRGFQNAMTDFALAPEQAFGLFDRIIDHEKRLMRLAAEEGMDGVIFWDDWGRQDSLLISPDMWRLWFKPRYGAQFRYAHDLGLTVWFHCCGKIDDIIVDFHEIGVDVINISQPNVVDIEKAGAALKGKQCFMVPISYQTVSIAGTPEQIHDEARRLYRALGTADGGFIGYIEEYSCMGMSEENYEACKSAFRSL